MLDAVLNWARERKMNRLGLWARADSPAAIVLYRQAGFHETENRRPLPGNPEFEIAEMVCELGVANE